MPSRSIYEPYKEIDVFILCLQKLRLKEIYQLWLLILLIWMALNSFVIQIYFQWNKNKP